MPVAPPGVTSPPPGECVQIQCPKAGDMRVEEQNPRASGQAWAASLLGTATGSHNGTTWNTGKEPYELLCMFAFRAAHRPCGSDAQCSLMFRGSRLKAGNYRHVQQGFLQGVLLPADNLVTA